jgi:predicted dehydrogenase
MSGDYTRADWLFKAKKAARYVRLYGLSRTLVKIRGQYHMKAGDGFAQSRWENPDCRDRDVPERSSALIGCGNYAFSNIAYYLRQHERRFLRATHDADPAKARSLCKAYGGAYAARDWSDVLTDPLVKIVFVASNHASHADYAVASIEHGKHVHIEKPHVVTEEQLARLEDAMRRHPESKVFLGFNRPRSRLYHRLQRILAGEPGPYMINWFIAGHHIEDDHWYFDEKEGGRVLGNLCHWTDCTLHLVTLEKAFPCEIVPASPPNAKSDFVVSMIFADGSCASITFSAKGHTFEGVREVLNVHKGNVLANITDFQELTADIVEKKKRVHLLHRDHGHRANILNSARGAANSGTSGESPAYVAATARLFLGVRRAIDTGTRVIVPREDAAS